MESCIQKRMQWSSISHRVRDSTPLPGLLSRDCKGQYNMRIDKFLPPSCLHLSPSPWNTPRGKKEAPSGNRADPSSPPTAAITSPKEISSLGWPPHHHLDDSLPLEEYSVKCTSPHFSRQQLLTYFRLPHPL